MVSIKAKYDGMRLVFAEKIELSKEEEVMIVLNREKLIEDEVSGIEIQSLIMDSGSLSFLEAEDENVYSDKDLKVKY